ncbi:MAG: hypothetical protein ABS939_02590 [Psychrobacillus sp.]
MKAIVVNNCHYAFNTHDYWRDEVIEVEEINEEESDYYVLLEDGEVDYIPKDSVELIIE